jgi:hypothetical protein
MAQHFNISGELTQQLIAPGLSDHRINKISLTNVQKVGKCKVDLFIQKVDYEKVYLLKNVELPIGATLVYDDARIKSSRGEFGLYIKLTDGASFELTGDINPTDDSTTVTGTNTLFLSEISPGDELEVTGETKEVRYVASDTSLTINTTYSGSLATDLTPTCNPQALVDVIVS